MFVVNFFLLKKLTSLLYIKGVGLKWESMEGFFAYPEPYNCLISLYFLMAYFLS